MNQMNHINKFKNYLIVLLLLMSCDASKIMNESRYVHHADDLELRDSLRHRGRQDRSLREFRRNERHKGRLSGQLKSIFSVQKDYQPIP